MKKLPLLLSLFLLGLALLLYFILPDFHNFIHEAFEVLTSDDRDRIRNWVEQFGLWGPVVFLLMMVVQMFLFVVPNVFLMVIAIVSYGPFWGALLSLGGVFLSSSIGYLIGKYLGPVTVHKLMGEKAEKKTAEFINTYGIPAIAITRLSSLSNDSLSIVAGLLQMRYKSYILATLSGITPLIVLLAVYGNRGQILNALIWIAAVSLVLLAIYIIVDKRRKKQTGNQTA